MPKKVIYLYLFIFKDSSKRQSDKEKREREREVLHLLNLSLHGLNSQGQKGNQNGFHMLTKTKLATL